MSGPTPTLRTERLVLRAWQPEDRPPFAELNADPAVMEHFPATLDRAASDALVDRFDALWAEGGPAPWAVEAAATGDFVGFVGLLRATFLPGEPIEVGWRLARAHWGRGFATEAATSALAHAFEVRGVDEVVSFTVPANVRSRRVMERVGLTHRPDRDFDHPRVDTTRHPHLVRHVLHALDAGAWGRWNAGTGRR